MRSCRWFKPLEPCNRPINGALTLRSDNSIYQYWIEENYLPQLKAAAAKVLGLPVTIRFDSRGGPMAAPAVKADTPKAKASGRARRGVAFTCARSTRAARSIRAAPSRRLSSGENNQLRRTPRRMRRGGGSGAHVQPAFPARPRRSRQDAPDAVHRPSHPEGTSKHLKVFYVTSEQFTNDYISAIQQGELAKFRRSYRQVDVLLIDDIQFLAGKDRSQEEFFHTFNSALRGRPADRASPADSPPTEIANIEKRLTSRFEMGPDRRACSCPTLRHGLPSCVTRWPPWPQRLPDPVLAFIAERVKTNVRRLEGALTRVAAFSSLHGRAISVPQVEVLLRDLLQQEGQQTVSIDLIQRRVAETYDLRLADMTSKRRPANIALPRMVAMYLSRRLTTASLNEIGDAFGGRDHGTVLHANRTIEAKMTTDENLRRIVTYLAEKLVASNDH